MHIIDVGMQYYPHIVRFTTVTLRTLTEMQVMSGRVNRKKRKIISHHTYEKHFSIYAPSRTTAP
jgi:hypothetical protein